LLVLYEDLIANSSATMELAYNHAGLHPGMYTHVVEESERHALPIFQSDISGKIHSGVSAVHFSKGAESRYVAGSLVSVGNVMYCTIN
jgi:hypothetical protein